MRIEARLEELGLRLPAVAPAVGNYASAVHCGSLLFRAGHGPHRDG